MTASSWRRDNEDGKSGVDGKDNSMDYDVSFSLARDDEAKTISNLRHVIWGTTYRGIYPDEAIDGFDLEWHTQRNLARIKDPDLRVYLIRFADIPIGYFFLKTTDPVYIGSLYLLKEYQHQGIGRRAFRKAEQYCAEYGISRYYCNCNAHNYPAIEFYHAMGGVMIDEDTGHENKQEDQLTFEFKVN